jgi:hypothetical protein
MGYTLAVKGKLAQNYMGRSLVLSKTSVISAKSRKLFLIRNSSDNYEVTRTYILVIDKFFLNGYKKTYQ